MPRRLLFATLAVGLAAGTLGCSKDGDVFIQNRTGDELSGSIDNRGFGLTDFGNIELSIKVGSSFLFFGPEEKDVILEGESCTLFPFSRTVRIRANARTEVEILPDATCIVFENESEWRVTDIFMRTEGETDWGKSIIAAPLPERSTIRRRFSVEQYEFLLVDECQDSTYVEGDSLYTGRILFVRHRGEPFCDTGP